LVNFPKLSLSLLDISTKEYTHEPSLAILIDVFKL
jgi:hypothetical protein